MNIILISDDRLKVVLTDNDLSSYGIRIEDIDYGNTETKRVFWTILDKAKNETGFDAALSRIFIQIYPDARGGCEMYVSRIGDKKSVRRGSDRVQCAVGGTAKELGARVEFVYRFCGVDGLISVCKLLRDSGFSGVSSAYAGENGGFCYLIAESGEGNAMTEFAIRGRLAEYGDDCGGGYGKWRVMEHCSLICWGNAVETLSNL